jgi:phage/plasmid primase-like uncharacterized protein
MAIAVRSTYAFPPFPSESDDHGQHAHKLAGACMVLGQIVSMLTI